MTARALAGTRVSGFAKLMALGALLRLLLPFEVLNNFEHYTRPGGSAVEKLHPGALLILALYGVSWFAASARPGTARRKIVAASRLLIAALCAVAALGVLSGRTEGLSYLLDSMIIAPVACLLVERLGERDRAFMLQAVMFAIIANAVLLIWEYLTHDRLISYPYIEPEFRATALFGHPLAASLLTVIAIPLSWELRWPLSGKIAATLLLLVATFCCGARIATMVAVVVTLLAVALYLRSARRRRRIDRGLLWIGGLTALMLLTIAVVLLVEFGLASRLTNTPLMDASALSRFRVYDIFGVLNNSEMLFGTHRTLANALLQGPVGVHRSESALVDFVLQFGVIGTAVLVFALARFLSALALASGSRYAVLEIGAFLVIALSNNTFSAKGPLLVAAALLAVCSPRERYAYRLRPPPRGLTLRNPRWRQSPVAGFGFGAGAR